MIKPCVRCKNQQGENELRNVRGDENVEGKIIVDCPEVLHLAENDPIEVCVNCLRELNDGNNNSQQITTKPPNRSRIAAVISQSNQSAIRDSEDLHVSSQSLGSVINAPLSSSVGANLPVNQSLDIEKLQQPGEIEKLAPNNRNVQQRMRELLKKSMPAIAKKRKLQEMLGNAPNELIDDGQRSSSNSQSETVIERPNTQDVQAHVQMMMDDYMNRSGRVQRSYKADSKTSASSSVSSNRNVTVINSVSLEKVIETPADVSRIHSPSPAHRTPEQRLPSQRSRVQLYAPDSSSDSSDRVRNASFPSDNEQRRQSSERGTSRDVGQAAAARRSSRGASRSSTESEASRRSVDRRQNDGNDHSNLAAPRRINLDPPLATRPQHTQKSTTGG